MFMRIKATFSASLLALIASTVLTVVVPIEAERNQSPPPGGQPPASPSPPPQQPPAQPQPPAQQPPGQQQPDRAQQPIRTGINFVRVDVIVTGKNGEPLFDLKPEEFTVEEDGKPQKIDTFQVIKIDAVTQLSSGTIREITSPEDERREAQRPDARLFIILLDDYHVRRGNDMVVRKPLIDFVQNQLGPADMVALMYPLTPVTDLTFTRNRDSLSRAIEKFEGRRFDYNPRNEFEERYAYYPAAAVEKIRNDVTLSALEGATVKLAGMREGRKSIILVSEGFTALLPPQLNEPIAAMPGIGNNPARGNPNVTVDERTEFAASTEMLSVLQDVFREANRNNTSIYAVDPRGLAAFEYDINHGIGLQADRKYLENSLDTLRILADNTDGKAIINRNDLAAGMKQIIRDSSGYYLIGYNSTGSPTDGKFHQIKVRVSRRGTEVRARKGYWAYTAEDAARATAAPAPEAPAAITSALSGIAEPPRGRSARFWVGTSRGENGRTLVTFLWEPIPAKPGEQRPAPDGPARVALTAITPDGKSLFRGKVPQEGSATGTTGTTPGARMTFEAPPGQVQMRMVVEGADGQVLDSTTKEMTLPDYTRVQVSFGTAQVFRGRTQREIQALKSDPNAVPTADRQFMRTDRAFARVQAFAPGETVPTVTARLLNNKGDGMSDLPVQTTPSGVVELDLPLGNLAPGDYLIEFSAKTPTGTAQELVAFKIGR
jgi:VWFA-related protein